MPTSNTPTSRDHVFRVRENGIEVWRIAVGGRILGDWMQRGPAEAGLAVEQQRAARRELPATHQQAG